MHGLVPDWGRLRAGSRDVDITVCSKSGTGRNHTTVVGVQTLLDGSGLYVLIPAIEKVSVEAIPSSVAVREYKLSSS